MDYSNLPVTIYVQDRGVGVGSNIAYLLEHNHVLQCFFNDTGTIRFDPIISTFLYIIPEFNMCFDPGIVHESLVSVGAYSQHSDISRCQDLHSISLSIEDDEPDDIVRCKKANPHYAPEVVKQILSLHKNKNNVPESGEFAAKVDVPMKNQFPWRLYDIKGIIASALKNRSISSLINGGSANAGWTKFLNHVYYGCTKETETTLQYVGDCHVVVGPWQVNRKFLVPAKPSAYKFRQLYILIYALRLVSTKAFNIIVRNEKPNIAGESIHMFDTVVQFACLGDLSDSAIMKQASSSLLRGHCQASRAEVCDSYGALSEYSANIVVTMQSRGPSPIFAFLQNEFGCYFLTIRHSTFNWERGLFLFLLNISSFMGLKPHEGAITEFLSKIEQFVMVRIPHLIVAKVADAFVAGGYGYAYGASSILLPWPPSFVLDPGGKAIHCAIIVESTQWAMVQYGSLYTQDLPYQWAFMVLTEGILLAITRVYVIKGRIPKHKRQFCFSYLEHSRLLVYVLRIIMKPIHQALEYKEIDLSVSAISSMALQQYDVKVGFPFLKEVLICLLTILPATPQAPHVAVVLPWPV
ncbi:hypothetical protein ACHQM5_020817 [Ranunculus cassubicifolius]